LKILFGLGNPEQRYLESRHNVGFMFIDYLADKYGYPGFKSKFNGEIAVSDLFGNKILLVKPQTYMNRSGYCVSEVVRYYKVTLEDWIVVYDDLDIEFGKTRIRETGGAGGHNGVRSIIEQVGEKEFLRVKVGIGRSSNKHMSEADWVLSSFVKEELSNLREQVFPEVEKKVLDLLER